MDRFTFGNALSHWSRADGPKGFIWKYLATYIVTAVVLGLALSFGLSMLLGALAGGPASDFEFGDNWIVVTVLYIVGGAFALAIWAVFESAMQRRYVRADGFSLRFGGDELRLMVVGLWWMFMLAIIYFLSLMLFAVVATPIMMAAGETRSVIMIVIVPVVLTLALTVTLLAFVARWSPAAAMTIRDRKITFFSAWSATRKSFWPIFWAYVVMSLILGAIYAVIYFTTLLMTTNPALVFEDIEAGLGVTLLGLGMVLIMLLYQAFAGYAIAGIGALVAKTDPKYAGMEAAAVFE